jgi:hypothetical protein
MSIKSILKPSSASAQPIPVSKKEFRSDTNTNTVKNALRQTDTSTISTEAPDTPGAPQTEWIPVKTRKNRTAGQEKHPNVLASNHST